MDKKPLEEFNCSWARAASQIGDKWSLMIVRDAFFGVRTFSAFVSNTGIAKNILSQRLDHLQKNGIIEKRPVGIGSTRSEYSLTDKGRALAPLMAALGQWGDKWIFGEGKEPIKVVDRKKGKEIQTIAVRDSSGRELTLDTLTFEAGPGANDRTNEIMQQIKHSIS